jgi:DNA polymerase I-like protein with 3'-5' exonuclease and polymerase domains
MRLRDACEPRNEMLLRTAYFKPERGCSQPEVDRAYVLLERAGFALDVPYLNRQADRATEDEAQSLKTLAGFSVAPNDINWASAAQLTKLIHEDLGLEPSPIWKKGEVRDGEIKMDGVALEYLAATNPEYSLLLREIINLRRIRGCLKYLRKLPLYVNPKTGLVHPVYGTPSDDDDRSGAATGRSVMKNPEGQQMPNSEEKDPYAIRKAFIAPPGQVLVVRDYQAMEAVLLHCLCLALFNDDSLSDSNTSTFHSVNARLVFGHYLKWKHPVSGRQLDEYELDDFKSDPYLIDRRRDAKTVFYGLQFCKGARGFGYTLLDSNGRPIGEAAGQQIVDAFHKARPGLKKWQDYVWNYLWESTRKKDFLPGIGTFSGRWRNVSHLVEKAVLTRRPDWQFRKAWRQLCNHPEQGGGADIKTTALVHLQRNLGKGCIVQNDIHDELIVRCPENLAEDVDAIMKECMEETYELPCGVKLQTGGGSGVNWYDAK